ncbi:hypothetical protein LGT39_00705 [Demequina sp. TTPB684]|uniref:hypothetical protein n=1 Tax=unclassified Demequina TaxID=2620311 RepID=UPI001CF28D01|nr:MULTISPECIES: hypothetical protein [unclassified Demequina]MCB2411364.1 hypothetical protein [Demequina sp. TTPB684]UPU88067.1 hypothetical protein LGT36_012585 [Demequina sp. TMPB413]
MGDSPLRMALRWLAHPLSLAAIAVMALNDHVLKQAYGTWWTGKLSDVAGLIFFPALVAVALAGAARLADAHIPRLDLVATAVTGVGFVWVKATGEGASTASALLTVITGPGIIRADATDLLALPALGLAVWAARASALEVRGGRERSRRAVGVVVLPLALLASVATTAPVEPSPGIVADDAGAWFWHADGSLGYDGDPYYTYTGEGWELFYEYNPAEPAQFAPDAHRSQWEDCVPSDPTVCFRVMNGGHGVEASRDGGETWRVDWALTDDEVVTLSEAYGVPAQEFTSTGVGVVETSRGFVVVASNGRDGFAVRGEDRRWERVGFEAMHCCDSLAVADFDTVNELPRPRPLPVGWTMGLVLSTLGLPLLAQMLRHGQVSRAGAFAPRAGVFFYLIAAVSGISVLARNTARAPLASDDLVASAATCVILGVLCAMAVVAATAAFGLLRAGAVGATVLGWVLGAVVVGVAAEMVVLNPDSQEAIGFLALPVFLALYVPVARRLLARHVAAV